MNKPFYFTTTFNYFKTYESLSKKINVINNDTDIFYHQIDKSKFFLPENLGFFEWYTKHNYDTFENGHSKEPAHIDFSSMFINWINKNIDNKLK